MWALVRRGFGNTRVSADFNSTRSLKPLKAVSDGTGV